MNKHILFITFGDFTSLSDGGSKFSNGILESLKRIYKNFTTYNFYDNAIIKNKKIRKSTAAIICATKKLPIPVAYFYSSALIKNIINNIQGILERTRSPEEIVVIIDHLELCYLIPVLKLKYGSLIKIIHISHNHEPSLFQQRLSGSLIYKFSEYFREYSDFERDAIIESSAILSISADETVFYSDLLKSQNSITPPPVMTIPPIFSYPRHINRIDTNTTDCKIVFLANLNWWPNVQAYSWIRNSLSESLPSNIKIHIYGNGSLRYQDTKNIIHHGFIPDMYSIWEDATCSIAPITSGSGVNIKVAESLYNNIPVIGTKLAFKGISEENLGGTIAADLDSNQWASLLIEITKSRELISKPNYPDAEEILAEIRRFI